MWDTILRPYRGAEINKAQAESLQNWLNDLRARADGENVLLCHERSNDWWGGNLAHACCYKLCHSPLDSRRPCFAILAAVIRADWTCLRDMDAYNVTPYRLVREIQHCRRSPRVSRNLFYILSLMCMGPRLEVYTRRVRPYFERWQAHVCVRKHAKKMQPSFGILESSMPGTIEHWSISCFPGGVSMLDALHKWNVSLTSC